VKILLVNGVNPYVRSVSTIHKYVAVGHRLGHEVVVFGEPNPELPALPFSTDVNEIDLALFVIQVPGDFPDMPLLARLLDGVPRQRRAVVDLWGRFNETIRVNHDFNHLEKLDGHQGWEWEEALSAVSDRIFQPALVPLRAEVRSFLFHGYDPGAVTQPHESAEQAAEQWRKKPYGVAYVGNNWQRWGQIRRFLETSGEVGPVCLAGWDWDARPEWAVQKGIMGIDVDSAFLAARGVEVREGVRFDEVNGLLGQARFTPVFHRPLFRHLGFVTNRTFETFCADTLPVLMLPGEFVEAVYGPAALVLTPGEDLARHLANAMAHPEKHWDAVLRTRAHLARHHSFARRFEQLQNLLAG
jgi:hypothetical protein